MRLVAVTPSAFANLSTFNAYAVRVGSTPPDWGKRTRASSGYVGRLVIPNTHAPARAFPNTTWSLIQLCAAAAAK